MDPVLVITCSLMLSYIFVTAALHKWQGMAEFEATLAEYRVLPGTLAAGAARLVPMLEISAGICLLVPVLSAGAAVLAGLLLAAYTGAIALNLLRGRRAIDCGCGGPRQRQTLSEWLLLRNGILLLAAWAAALPDSGRTLAWFDWVVILLATAAACLFYTIGNQLLVNKDLLRHLRPGHG